MKMMKIKIRKNRLAVGFRFRDLEEAA